MSKKKLIIIDISNFIFRAFYAIRPLSTPQGIPVNAVYGVLSMLTKILNEHRPTHVLVARDAKEKSFREDLDENYKANRTSPPDDLVPQFTIIEELVRKLQLPSLVFPGYEADDIIGSITTQFHDEFDQILIASGDKDLMQFVDDKVQILDTMKDKIYFREDVFEKMGVYPEQIVDYLSLVGDSSDNIPGVKGIGAKGASELLLQFKDLENLLKHKSEVKNKRAAQALEAGESSALLSKKLVTIVCDLELGIDQEGLSYNLKPSQELIDFLIGLDFKSFVKKFKEMDSSLSLKNSEVEQDINLLSWDEWKKLKLTSELFILPTIDNSGILPTLLQMVVALETGESCVLKTESEFHKFYKHLSDSSLSHILVGIQLKDFIKIILQNDFSLSLTAFDIDLAHFILSSDSANFPSRNLTSQEHVSSQIQKIPEIFHAQKKEIQNKMLTEVFYQIDSPLLFCLAEMENRGILLDGEFFQKIEKEFSSDLEKIEQKIHASSDSEINIRSPKQLRTLLFEKLNLPVIKKTKTGPSTDSDVLSELERLGHSEIPTLILKYRELDKLLSTYIRSLPSLVHPRTGRVHTHFQLTVAATGRLSSDNPNLQNIPIRTEQGRLLRKGFISSPGHFLLSADYSQVELRIFAHFSQDPTMLKAFSEDRDIHTQTAAEIFHVPLEQVTREQRSSAKAINFGLMYGQSSFGLSQILKIDRRQAQDYITRYFKRFSRIKSYLDSLKEFCEKNGHTQTLFGRKRDVPDIRSTNRQLKSIAERIAINTPIQGTAADIIKIAMISIREKISSEKLNSKMLLQVHDELIFEVPEDEIDIMKKLVVEKMESAATLSVQLKVDVGVGKNWFDLK